MESVLLRIWSYIIIFSAGSEAVCCNYGTSNVTAGMYIGITIYNYILVLIDYNYVGRSCLDIIKRAPGCKGLSGYYWIDPHNTTAVQVCIIIISNTECYYLTNNACLVNNTEIFSVLKMHIIPCCN